MHLQYSDLESGVKWKENEYLTKYLNFQNSMSGALQSPNPDVEDAAGNVFFLL